MMHGTGIKIRISKFQIWGQNSTGMSHSHSGTCSSRERPYLFMSVDCAVICFYECKAMPVLVLDLFLDLVFNKLVELFSTL